MINSHRVVLKKQLIPSCRAIMQPYIKVIWTQFFEIFSDNSCNQRVTFFQDPLIHYLWGKFRIDYAGQINDYLNNLIGDSASIEDKKQRFLQDINQMQMISGCNILPNM